MISADELLKDLTLPQREAATHVDGPLLIIAGAGSGKTRVITRRVAYLVSLGIPANSILAITFTNKAAGEMKQRVSAVVKKPLRDFGKLDQPWPTICTFHSLCLRVLRHYAERIGLPVNFSIYDSADQNKLIKEALKSLDLSSQNFPPAAVHGAISKAKNQLADAQDFSQAAGDFYQRTVARVYTKYQALLKQNNALDFDDLLLRTAHMFREHPDILKELQQRFQYVLIDEYQDTNHVQYVVAHALAAGHRNLCVVGDPDQSIYAWRGADIQNILDFEGDYPDAKVVRLEQNYRSSKTILDIASKLIANNKQRKDKTLWTENTQGEKAKLFLCGDEHDEANTIMLQLRDLNQNHGYSWNKMAIFYRINALSRVMEDALRKANVPYQIARGVEFYNRKEIKDVLAYLRAIVNPSDEVSLSRIVNVPPRGLGDSSLKLMETFAVANGISLWEAMQRADEVTGISGRALNATRSFVKLMQHWQALRQSVQSIMEAVVKTSGLEDHLKKIGDDEREELANVNELITSAAEYDQEHPEGSLMDYLAIISLVSDVDHMRDGGGAVTLMTLHAAKGLEFPVVAMIGLEEGVLPHSRARESVNEMEEERRLCFVGITRAQERLILSKAAYRTIRGLRERTITSPFLGEMPKDMLEITDRMSGDFASSSSRFEDDYSQRETTRGGEFRRGMLVRHHVFGLGRVADVTEMGSQTRVVVEFNSGGRKILIQPNARLEAVG